MSFDSATIDDKINGLMPVLLKLEQGHAEREGMEGRYYQSLQTHTTAPKTGTKEVPDRAEEVTHHQSESFADMVNDPDNVLSEPEKAAALDLLNGMETKLTIHSIKNPKRRPEGVPQYDFKVFFLIEDAGTHYCLAFLGSEAVAAGGRIPEGAEWVAASN